MLSICPRGSLKPESSSELLHAAENVCCQGWSQGGRSRGPRSLKKLRENFENFGLRANVSKTSDKKAKYTSDKPKFVSSWKVSISQFFYQEVGK